jgi:hypothetical protein
MGLNWDAQWGWRMVLAFALVVFAGTLIACSLLDWISKRPLADRIARIEYEPKSIASPDYSPLHALLVDKTAARELDAVAVDTGYRVSSDTFGQQ